MWGSIRESKDKNSYLHRAVYHNKQRLVQLLLMNNKNYLYCRNKEGNTPLHIAAYYGNTVIVQRLLQYPNILEAENKHGNRALQIAAARKEQAILQIFLDSNAIINAKNKLGYTALHAATKFHFPKNVQLLLEHGANMNVKTKNCGDTALHIAVRGENKEIVLALLMYGANCEFKNDHGHSANFLALSYPHSSFDEMLPSDQGIIKYLLAFSALWGNDNWKESCFSDSLVNNCNHFYIECETEIEKMKLFVLKHSRISYYDILKYNITQIALLMRKKSMETILLSKLNFENFPIYSEMLDFKLEAALKQKCLIRQCINHLGILFKNYLVLPEFVAENIISYLDICDLKILCTSFICFETS